MVQPRGHGGAPRLVGLPLGAVRVTGLRQPRIRLACDAQQAVAFAQQLAGQGQGQLALVEAALKRILP